MFFTIGGSVIAGLLTDGTSDTIDFVSFFLHSGNMIGSLSGLYRGLRETRDLTGAVRKSS